MLPVDPITEQMLAEIATKVSPEIAEIVRAQAEVIAPKFQRDEAIRAAVALWPEMKPTPAARRLASELDRYLSSGWRHEKYQPTLSDGASDLRRLLHRIARLTGGDGSIGWRQIVNILSAGKM
jgi:hypothetical protein